MNPVVVLRAADAGKERLLFVRLVVAVHVGEHLHLVQRADDDARVFAIHRAEHAHAVRGIDVAPLIKHRLFVDLAIAVGVLKNENAVALGSLAIVVAIVDHLANPHAAAMVDVDIRRAK